MIHESQYATNAKSVCLDCVNARANICCWVASNGNTPPKGATIEIKNITRYQGKKLINESRKIIKKCPHRKVVIKPPKYDANKINAIMDSLSRGALMRMGFSKYMVRKWKERKKTINILDVESAAEILEREGYDVQYAEN